MSENREITVSCQPCCVCGKASHVVVNEVEYQAWQNGKHIQDALMSLPVEQRELLISGTHQECWQGLFGNES